MILHREFLKFLFPPHYFSYLPFPTPIKGGLAQRLKCLPPMWETWVQSLGWENPLEEGMATHSSILARRIPMDRGGWRVTVHRITKSWTRLSNYAQHTEYSKECQEQIRISKLLGSQN